MKKEKSNMKISPAWAWQFEEGELSHWAEPSKEQLLSYGLPSPEAKIVSVYIIKRKEYAKKLQIKTTAKSR